MMNRRRRSPAAAVIGGIVSLIVLFNARETGNGRLLSVMLPIGIVYIISAVLTAIKRKTREAPDAREAPHPRATGWVTFLIVIVVSVLLAVMPVFGGSAIIVGMFFSPLVITILIVIFILRRRQKPPANRADMQTPPTTPLPSPQHDSDHGSRIAAGSRPEEYYERAEELRQLLAAGIIERDEYSERMEKLKCEFGG